MTASSFYSRWRSHADHLQRRGEKEAKQRVNLDLTLATWYKLNQCNISDLYINMLACSISSTTLSLNELGTQSLKYISKYIFLS